MFSAAGMLYWRMFFGRRPQQSPGRRQRYIEILAQRRNTRQRCICRPHRSWNLPRTRNALDAEDIEPSSTDFDQAQSLLETALTIQQRLGLDYDTAATINNLGLLAYYRDDWEQAGALWTDAAGRFRAQHEWTAELGPMINLGVLELESGSLSASVAAFTRALEVLPPGEQAIKADALDNRARAHAGLGKYDLALRDFYTALTIHIDNANTKGQGRSLSGIATTYQSLGELSEAREFYERSLVFRELANDRRGLVATLIQLGNVCRQLGDFRCALDAHSKAVRIAPNPIFRARGGIALAVDYLQQGNPEDSPATSRIRDRNSATDRGSHGHCRRPAAKRKSLSRPRSTGSRRGPILSRPSRSFSIWA